MAQTVELSNGYTAIVDDEDFERVSRYKWSYKPVSGKGYAARKAYYGGGRKNPIRETIQLHRFIMGANDRKVVVDHINGDGLDNRRSNLRLCTQAENMRNSAIYSCNKTGYKGVHFNKRDGKYQANIRVNKKLLFLGYFDDALQAAKAYNNAAAQYFGEFARPNILEKI